MFVDPESVDVPTEAASGPSLLAVFAPLAVAFLKGCLLGLAIAGTVAVLDDILR